MNLFDILGPVMVGPSSSHTAGAVRIGRMARSLLGQEPVRAELFLHGSFASTGEGHGTHQALIAGLLGLSPDDDRVPGSFALAEERGLSFTFSTRDLRDVHPNSVLIRLEGDQGGQLEVGASSPGGGRILVNKVDGIDVSFDGMFNTLVIRNQDENGAVAAVTSVLNQLRINVANMSLCRHKRGGDALMVIETDQHIKPHQVAFLSELTGILSVTYYDKEDDDDVSGFDEGNL